MSCANKQRGAWLRIIVAAGFVLASLAQPAGAQQPVGNDEPIVAAASDLQFALKDIAAAFQRETGQRVRLSFGSSGNFARQIRQGAPFQLYLSADEDYVLSLARDGFTRGEGVLYGIGRVVLIVPDNSPLRADGSLESLAEALRDGSVQRFAIANPTHAPYGKRAEEVLRRKGVWDAIKPRLVFGENVSQAAQFALTGSTAGGIIAYSLALAPEVNSRGRFELIPEEWHSPLRQRMALLKNAGPVAEQFFAYLQRAEARRLFESYGFALPSSTE